MRQSITTTFLAVCAVLVAADLLVRWRSLPQPSAFGQTTSETISLAAGNTQNEVYCFLYNHKTQQLLSYRQKAKGGPELTGVRKCRWDFNDQIQEMPRYKGDMTVQKMKALWEKTRKKASGQSTP